MIQLIESEVVFDVVNHTYTTPDGLVLSGVTSVLGRNMFKDKYNGIPKAVMDKAAKKGSYVHEQLQSLDEFGQADDIVEVQNYKAMKIAYSIEPIANEYLVSDNTRYATAIDMIDADVNLYDFKTTSKLDYEYLSWQLSIGAYLFEMQNPHIVVGKLFAIWLRGSHSELREIKRIAPAIVEELLTCDNQGIPFIETTEISPFATHEGQEIRQLISLENLIAHIDMQLKEAKLQKEKMLLAFQKAMVENNQLSIETDRIKISLSKPSQRISIDKDALLADLPDVYKKYEKITEVKPSIRVTLKKQKNEQQTNHSTF